MTYYSWYDLSDDELRERLVNRGVPQEQASVASSNRDQWMTFINQHMKEDQ